MAQQVANIAQRSILDDSYELMGAIGRGSDSIIYRGRLLQNSPSASLGRIPANSGDLAIKIITSVGEDPEGAIRRVKCEVEALTLSQHPNVIALYDYKATEEICYLVLEYATHGNLQRVLDDYADPLSPERALKLTIQILNGLEAVHRGGVIHRDIKPENLLVTDRSTIKLSDFSIALHGPARAQLGDSNHAIGTLEYAAPEFLTAGAVSEASDLYAVGVTLFQFLSKRLPFEGHTLSQQVNRKVGGLRHALPESVRKESELLERLIEKALAPDRQKRFQSAREFRLAAEAVLNSIRSGSRRSLDQQVGRGATNTNLKHATTAAAQTFSNAQPTNATASGNRVGYDTQSPSSALDRNAQQLGRMREKRARTRTNYQELAPFVRRKSRFSPSLRSWKRAGLLSAVAVMFVGAIISFTFFDSSQFAEATLRPGKSSATLTKQTFSRGVFEFLFAKRSSNFTRIQPLTHGLHLGVLRNLFSEDEHVPFAVQGLGSGDRILVTLGIPGWEAKTIVLNPKARSGEIRIVGHGLDLSLNLVRPTAAEEKSANELPVLRGNYRERISGRTGSWSISTES